MGWDSWREDFQVDDWAYISWAGLGMGDHNVGLQLHRDDF
jgi:hypothetical protein